MKTYSELNTEKFIVFTVADYHFALPIAEVIQVVNRPPCTGELSKAGLVQIGRRVIRLLDLHQQLAEAIRQRRLREAIDHKPKNQSFLVITQIAPGEFCAIPVDEPPSLVEFPREIMQRLPQSSGESGVLRIASHAATILLNETLATVFLLNVNQLLAPTAVVQ